MIRTTGMMLIVILLGCQRANPPAVVANEPPQVALPADFENLPREAVRLGKAPADTVELERQAYRRQLETELRRLKDTQSRSMTATELFDRRQSMSGEYVKITGVVKSTYLNSSYPKIYLKAGDGFTDIIEVEFIEPVDSDIQAGETVTVTAMVRGPIYSHGLTHTYAISATYATLVK